MEAFGLAANVLSVIHITYEVIQRLNAFRASIEGLPKSLQTLSAELPLLTNCLEQIKCDLQNGQIQDGDDSPLIPLLKAFELCLKRLFDIIQKTRSDSESAMARNLKALTSFQYDSEVDRIREEIRGYTATLTLNYTIKPRVTLVAKQPPKPQFICPFSRDNQFVDRSILGELLTLQRPGSRYAIIGEGGIGKSQIAIEYGYCIREKAPETWIFWVDAEDINTIEQSYREIANALMLQGAANVFSMVYNWLRNETNGDWVMIIDNADDKSVLRSHPKQDAGLGDSKQLKEYIPQSMNGSVLVTSRSRDSAFEITCNYRYIKTIEPMGKDEGLSLLRCYLADAHQDDDMEKLLEAVDNIPLAISHAGSYITKRGMSIDSYLQELQSESGKGVSLQEDDITQLRRDARRGNSVVKTWMVTFDHIRATTPSAARLLSLMCHFARQSIPKAILQGDYSKQQPMMKRKSWWKRRFRTHRKKEEGSAPIPLNSPLRSVGNDLLTLQDFNLIKKNNDADEFSMHALVQLTTKRWLEQNKQLSFWTDRFIVILNDYLSRDDVPDLSTCENLFQHAAAATSKRPCDTSREALIAWASLAMKVASYCKTKRVLEEEQIMYGGAARAYGMTLGPDAPDTLRCALKRAHALLSMKRFAESEDAFRTILLIQQKSLGPEHLETLDTMELIAETLLRQARTAEAEELYDRISEIRCRKYGISDSNTVKSMKSRLSALARNDRGVEAFALWKKMFSSPSTICDSHEVNQLGYIGSILAMKGQLADAESCYQEFVAQRERISAAAKQSDADYLRLAEAWISLASVLVAQEKYKDAEPLLQQALEASKSPAMDRFRKADVDEFEITWLLTLTLTHLNKLDKAEEMARSNLSNHYKSGSSKSYRMWEATWALGGVLERKMNTTEAMQLYKNAYEGAMKDLGADHTDTEKYGRDYKALKQKVYKPSN